MTKKNQNSLMVVNGKPTKELFISMLIRDISLIDAISDLIDNCVDGAIRLRGGKSFHKMTVDISINDKQFIIKDNCGGIDKDIAQKCAFRFGRPPTSPKGYEVNYSVGQFGIGMKRALFKMGNEFEVKSISEKTSFVVKINVRNWQDQPDDWDFEFDKLENGNFPISARGTEITITSLKEDVRERFKQQNFISELIQKLELQHLINISRGMKIRIKTKTKTYDVKASQLKLLNSNKFATAYLEKKYKLYNNMGVKIYAGIAKADSTLGGWYIFCNNRLIKGPEQTEVTGWVGGRSGELPKYHIQYIRFRGFVFFEAKEPGYLPWNTSKNGVDIDSPIFRSVRQDMINLAKPIITFLNKVHKESVNHSRDEMYEEYLEKEMESANLRNYQKVKTGPCFIAPERKGERTKRNEVTIQYKKPRDEVNMLKKVFKVSSAKDVGEKTFDYTYKRECK